MTFVFDYFLKLSIGLAVVYLFYQLVLRRLTFYNWNRLYLLVYTLLCFYIPFINVHAVLGKNELDNNILSFIPALNVYTGSIVETVNCVPVTTAGWDKWDWISLVFYVGVSFLLIRFITRLLSFLNVRRKAQLILDDTTKVYQVDEPISPFSFGNSIFINQQLHTSQELREIIRHEFVHVKQRHTIDIVCSELLCIVNWYNPFAWLMRKAIRQNLEFIADQQVLQTGCDRREYQYLLLKVIGVSSFSIASNFNFSSLKKRIAMMNKTKSAKVHLMRFLFILPLLVVILLAFRNSVQQNNLQQVIKSDTVKPGSSNMPNTVNSIQSNNGRVTVTLKNGQVEKYNLHDGQEKNAFESKYGKMPEAPTPPAMPPGEIAEMAPPPPPHPIAEDCFNKKGYCITIADNNGECVVIVKDKKNKIVEAVTLVDWDKDKKFVEKYGEIPPLPPPAIIEAPVPPGAVSINVNARPAKVRTNTTVSANPSVSVNNVPAVASVPEAPAAVPANPALTEVVVVGRSTELEVIATITNNTTREQLEQIKKELKEIGYTMEIETLNFDDGKLLSIKGTVTNNDGGNWVFSASEFKTVTFGLVKGKDEKKALIIRVGDGKVGI